MVKLQAQDAPVARGTLRHAVAGSALQGTVAIMALKQHQMAVVAVGPHRYRVGAAAAKNRTLHCARTMPNGMPYFKPGNTITMRPLKNVSRL